MVATQFTPGNQPSPGTQVELQKWYSLEQVVGLLYEARIGTGDPTRNDAIAELISKIASNQLPPEQLAQEQYSKRLDTYILNQGESLYRGLPELITNGIDASERLIGRFGMGFFQSLAFLKDPGDLLTVSSKTQDNPQITLQFRKSASSIEVSFSGPEPSRAESAESGTTITFTKARADNEFANNLAAYTKSIVERCNLARININGELCNSLKDYKLLGNPVTASVTPDVDVHISESGFSVRDYGRGMSPADVRDKLLIPKFNDETASHQDFDAKRVAALFKQRRNNDLFGVCDVRVQVSGILIETVRVTGANLPESLIIELPPGTWLPESRNQVQLNHQVASALLELAKISVNEIESAEYLPVLNAIAGVIAELEQRPGQDKTCSTTLKSLVSNVLKNLKQSAIPNNLEFQQLDLPNRTDIAVLHPSLVTMDCKKLGFSRPENFQSSSHTLWLADLKSESNTSFVMHGDVILFDRKLYYKFRDVPGVLNELLDPNIRYGIQEPPKGRFTSLEPQKPDARSQFEGLDLSSLPPNMAASLEMLLSAGRQRTLEANQALSNANEEPAIDARSPIVEVTAGISAETVRRLRNAADLFEGTQIAPETLLFQVRQRKLLDQVRQRKLLDFDELSAILQSTKIIDLHKVLADSLKNMNPKNPPTRDEIFGSLRIGTKPGKSLLNPENIPQKFERLPAAFDQRAIFVDKNNGRILIENQNNNQARNPKDLSDDEVNQNYTIVEADILKGNPAGFLNSYKLSEGAIIIILNNSISKGSSSVLKLTINGELSQLKFPGAQDVDFRAVSNFDLPKGYLSLLSDNQLKIVEVTESGLQEVLSLPGSFWVSALGFPTLNGEPAFTVQDGDTWRYVLFVNYQGKFRRVSDFGGLCPRSLSALGIDLIEHGGHLHLFNGATLIDLSTLLGPPTQLWISNPTISAASLSQGISGRNKKNTVRGARGSLHHHEIEIRSNAFGRDSGSVFKDDMLVKTRELLETYTELVGDSPATRQKLFCNLWLCETSSPEDLVGLFPWLMALEPVAVAALPTAIRDAVLPLAKNNPKLFRTYCKVFSEAYSRFGDSPKYTVLVERWFHLSKSLPILADKVLQLLERNFGNSNEAKTGWTFFWPDECKEAPPELRPYLEYLFGDYRYAMNELSSPYDRNVSAGQEEVAQDHLSNMPLAELVDSVRRLSRAGEITSLSEITRNTSNSLGITLIERELAKTANSQDRSSLIRIRELLQNSRDALRKSRGTGQVTEPDKIEIDSFFDGQYFGTTVRDSVGMSLHDLVCYLLIPDNSSKIKSSSLSGFFGHGFFTTFLGASQVVIKTSTGDGKIYQMTLDCKHNEMGALSGISIRSFKEIINGDYKGTEITHLEACDRVSASLRHALVSDAAYCYASTINPKECQVSFNQQVVNQPSKQLVGLKSSAGTIGFLTMHDKFSRVTSDQLYLMSLNDRFGTLIPEILKSTLERVGFIVDLPPTIRPTRARNAISQEQDVLGELKAVIAVGALTSSIKLFLEEDFDIPGIPRDYLYSRGAHSVTDSEIIRDAALINNYLLGSDGHADILLSINFDRYVAKENGHALAQLLTLIRTPIASSEGDVFLSLSELRDNIIKQEEERRSQNSATSPASPIPEESQESPVPGPSPNTRPAGPTELTIDPSKLVLGPDMKAMVGEARQLLGARHSAPATLPNDALSNDSGGARSSSDPRLRKEESRLLELAREFIQLTYPNIILQYVYGGYYEAAYCKEDSSIIVNLSAESVRSELLAPLKAFSNGMASSADLERFARFFVSLFTHEMTHASDTGWTHQNDTRFPESFRYRYERLLRTILSGPINPTFFPLCT
jgi:hypothetical protein